MLTMGIYCLRALAIAAMVFSAACSSGQHAQTWEKTNTNNPNADNPNYRYVLASLRNDAPIVPEFPQWHPVTLVYNREAIIPPQCYTKTEGHYNPCYVCHQNALPERENVMNDLNLQVAYSFSELGTTNHWQNLFEDKTERMAAISDAEIKAWVDQDNYSNLVGRLQHINFKGWLPDLNNLQLAEQAFDDSGFAKDGSLWVAFNYKPFPSTFWPTNGATDDVMIRLAPSFYTNAAGELSLDVYKANLAVLEANIKGLTEISSLPVNEQKVGVDLNQDGKFSTVNHISRTQQYVGKAKDEFIDTYLYPEGTEFLHTVRYLGVTETGEIKASRRIKEVRYMKKWRAYAKPIYARQYQLEGFEKEAGNLPGYQNLGHYGLDNGNGWAISGFIEDKHGELRVSTFEENLFCMGCHNSIGSTIDKTFSFARKVDGAKGWGYLDLKAMVDVPSVGEQQGEILTYFERVGGGDEFRNNQEMLNRWFNTDGSVKKEKVETANNVYELITPSVERAMALNKAYKVIVEQQDYIFGRDAILVPPKNVYGQVDNLKAPTLNVDNVYQWDIRLNWSL